jgi:hypothetical protein
MAKLTCKKVTLAVLLAVAEVAIVIDTMIDLVVATAADDATITVDALAMTITATDEAEEAAAAIDEIVTTTALATSIDTKAADAMITTQDVKTAVAGVVIAVAEAMVTIVPMTVLTMLHLLVLMPLLVRPILEAAVVAAAAVETTPEVKTATLVGKNRQERRTRGVLPMYSQFVHGIDMGSSTWQCFCKGDCTLSSARLRNRLGDGDTSQRNGTDCTIVSFGWISFLVTFGSAERGCTIQKFSFSNRFDEFSNQLHLNSQSRLIAGRSLTEHRRAP